MTTIYLIRHGAYKNPQWIFHGRLPGFPLSVKGRKQVTKIAKLLKRKPITAIYSSRLDRARETAEIIAKHSKLPVWTDERLLDIRSPLEGIDLDYIRRPKFSFYEKPYILAGGETMMEVYHRMNHFIRQKMSDHENEHIVVVTHGDGIMTVAYKYAGKKLPDFFPYDNTYVKEGEGYKLEFDTIHIIRIRKIP
jgi:broad specificity phosphatase PhoE